MNRRGFLTATALLSLPLDTLATPQRAEYLLVGDSEAGYLQRPLLSEAKRRDLRLDVRARPGSSTRQWLKRGWFEAELRRRPGLRTVMINLGVNCTRVERPVLARDIDDLVLIANDLGVAPAWLLPPPLAMDTSYLVKAVAVTEVWCFAPGVIPLFDGIHPTPKGCRLWAKKIAETLWE